MKMSAHTNALEMNCKLTIIFKNDPGLKIKPWSPESKAARWERK